MVYITSIPKIIPNIYTHQNSEGRLSTLTKTVNTNPTSYILLNIELLKYYPKPKYLIIGSFGPLGNGTLHPKP